MFGLVYCGIILLLLVLLMGSWLHDDWLKDEKSRKEAEKHPFNQYRHRHREIDRILRDYKEKSDATDNN